MALWDEYARENNVIVPSRSPYDPEEKLMPEHFPVEAGYPPILYKKQYVPPTDMMAKPKD